MRKVLVTGSKGFIGRNLIEALKTVPNIEIITFDVEDEISKLEKLVEYAHFIYHFAGVNRPSDISDFEKVNVGLTREIINIILKVKKRTSIVFTSSIHAESENPYGISKRKAEEIILEYSRNTKSIVYLYRLPGVFGKWCRPNYNSVVATFCHNIARDLDIEIDDPEKEISLVYIDDVIEEFIKLLEGKDEKQDERFYGITRVFKITLGELAQKIYELADIRRTLKIPDLANDFMRFLYATYLSHFNENGFSYMLDVKKDHRGILCEIIKSQYSGQIFISKSYRGVIRGNHYHNTKVEKFCVIQGSAVIRLRNILKDEIISYCVSGDKIEIVDIPPGYTHSLENTGDGELIVLFWADEIFDPNRPDTYSKEV